MKFFVVFFLLISWYPLGSHSYPFGSNFGHLHEKTEQRKKPLVSERTLKTEEILLQLKNQINEYTSSLMLVLF